MFFHADKSKVVNKFDYWGIDRQEFLKVFNRYKKAVDITNFYRKRGIDIKPWNVSGLIHACELPTRRKSTKLDRFINSIDINTFQKQYKKYTYKQLAKKYNTSLSNIGHVCCALQQRGILEGKRQQKTRNKDDKRF